MTRLEVLRALVGRIPPHPLWAELLWQRHEEIAKRNQAAEQTIPTQRYSQTLQHIFPSNSYSNFSLYTILTSPVCTFFFFCYFMTNCKRPQELSIQIQQCKFLPSTRLLYVTYSQVCQSTILFSEKHCTGCFQSASTGFQPIEPSFPLSSALSSSMSPSVSSKS